MKIVLLIQLAVLFFGCILTQSFRSTQQAISFATGASLILVNLIILTWVWLRLLNKKLIALATAVIVFKYSIFGLIIYKILILPGIDSVWFSVGLSTIMATALIYAVFFSWSRR